MIDNKWEVTALTKGGEEILRTKINPNKRHSKNNTIIGWSIYKNGVYKESLLNPEVNHE